MVKLLSANHFGVALILLVTGCGGEPIGAKVSFLETRVDETQSPLPFVIALRNEGDAAIDVAGVSVATIEGFALPSGGDERVDGNLIAPDECEVEMREGHPVEVGARGDGVACGFLRWAPAGEARRTVGVAATGFLVTLDDGETVATPPRIVLLSSQAGAAETFIGELLLDREMAQSVLRRIESLDGEPTAQVERLIGRLRSLSQ